LDDKRPISWTAGFKLGEMLDTGSEWVKDNIVAKSLFSLFKINCKKRI